MRTSTALLAWLLTMVSFAVLLVANWAGGRPALQSVEPAALAVDLAGVVLGLATPVIALVRVGTGRMSCRAGLLDSAFAVVFAVVMKGIAY